MARAFWALLSRRAFFWKVTTSTATPVIVSTMSTVTARENLSPRPSLPTFIPPDPFPEIIEILIVRGLEAPHLRGPEDLRISQLQQMVLHQRHELGPRLGRC